MSVETRFGCVRYTARRITYPSETLVRKLRDEIPDSAIKSHLTIQSIPQSTPTQNLEAIISERLAEERAGMEATIRERVASVERLPEYR